MLHKFAFILFLSFASISFASDYGFEKRQLIWQQVLDSELDINKHPIESVSFLSILNAFSKTFLTKTFTVESDYLPEGRDKIIHKTGTTALVTLLINNKSPFSGLLAPGNSIGLIRLSTAAGQSASNFIPGMALKLFVDHKPSANMVAMNSLEGQAPNGDFFALPFSNKIAEPTSAALKFGAKLFQNAMDMIVDDGKPNYLPLQNFTSVNRDGSTVKNIQTPHHLIFVPLISSSTNIKVDFRAKLSQIPSGSIIYEVFASHDAKGSNIVSIGRMVLNSKFVASEFGDKQLFFQHNIK